MSWDNDVWTNAIWFLSGTLVGAAGKYMADKYTDQRHAQERRRDEKKRFERIQTAMPGLIAEMKADLATHELVRDFVVLPSPTNHYNSSYMVFRYYEDQHQDLQAKVTLLVSAGYAEDRTEGIYKPLYRMTQKFVDHIQAS